MGVCWAVWGSWLLLALTCFWCCPFVVCGRLLWVFGPDGCRQVGDSEKGEQEAGEMCCGSWVRCEWPGLG